MISRPHLLFVHVPAPRLTAPVAAPEPSAPALVRALVRFVLSLTPPAPPLVRVVLLLTPHAPVHVVRAFVRFVRALVRFFRALVRFVRALVRFVLSFPPLVRVDWAQGRTDLPTVHVNISALFPLSPSGRQCVPSALNVSPHERKATFLGH